jgi:hypothetical protein
VPACERNSLAGAQLVEANRRSPSRRRRLEEVLLGLLDLVNDSSAV